MIFFNDNIYSEGNTNYKISLLFKSAFPFIFQFGVINFNMIAGDQHKRIFQHPNILPTTMYNSTCDILYHLMAYDNLMI